MIAVLATFLPSLLLGLTLLCWLRPRGLSGARRLESVLICGYALALGLGCVGLLIVALCCAGVRNRWALIGVELAVSVLFAFLALRRNREAESVSIEPATLARPLLTATLGIAFAFAAWKWIAFTNGALAASPHGQWDAWAVWNVRARFLVSDDWRAGFSPELMGHPDYPLLLPAIIAHGWTLLGTESMSIPSAVAATFTFATVFVMTLSLAVLRGATHGLLAGLVLMGCVSYAGQGATQYADVPIAFLYLLTLALLAHHDQTPEGRRGWLILAGLAAGMAASTKNEGQAFFVCAGASLLMVTWLQHGRHEAFRASAAFGLGALPFLIMTFSVKLFLAPENWFFRQKTELSLSERALSLQRHKLIAKYFWSDFKSFGGFAGPLATYLLAFYALVAGLRIERGHAAPWVGGLTILGTIASVYLVYLITPYNLQWQLDTSASRLFIQWLPSLIFVYFLWLDTPERIAGDEKASSAVSDARA